MRQCVIVLATFLLLVSSLQAESPLPAPIVFTGHNALVRSVWFLPDGLRVVSGGDDDVVRVWDISNGKETANFPGHSGHIYGVSASADGKFVASAAMDHTARIWDLQAGRLVKTFKTERELTNAVFSMDGGQLLVGGLHGIARIFDLRSESAVKGWPAKVLCGGYGMAWSKDGRYFATAGHTDIIYVWDARNMTQVRKLTGNWGECHVITFSPDGRFLLSGHVDHIIRLWDVDTGAMVREFAGHNKMVGSLSFHPSGRMFISAAWENNIPLWDVVSGTQIKRFEGHTMGVGSVSFSPDGRMFVSGSNDGTARTWRMDMAGPAAPPPAVVVAVKPAPPIAPPAMVFAPPAVVQPPAVTAVAPPPAVTTVAPPLATPPAPPMSVTPPVATTPPVDPNAIERPEYRDSPKSVVKRLTSITSMMVRISNDGDAMGLTNDIIAATELAPRKSRDRTETKILSKVGKDMEISYKEAIRAVRGRYPFWSGGEIEISFGDKYSEHDGGSAGTAFGVLLLSALEGIDLDSKCALTGDITVDWKVRKVGAVADKLHGAILDKCLYAAIPADNAQALDDMRLLHGDANLWQIQTFSITTLQDAIAIVRTDRAPQLAEAINLFASLQARLAKYGRSALSSPDVKQTFARVLELAPNHLSAKALQLMSNNVAPQSLSDSATIDQIMLIAYPYRHFLAGHDFPTSYNLPHARTVNARKQLNALRPIANKDVAVLLTDLAAYIERADAATNRAAKPEEVNAKRMTFLEHFSNVCSDKNLIEKISREGD